MPKASITFQDIGNTFRRNLVAFRQTGVPVEPSSDHDAGNGAAMRVLPVALATLGQSAAGVCAAVQAQAHVTHNNAISDVVCEFLTLAVQDFLRGLSLPEMVSRRIQPMLADHPELLCIRDRPRRQNPSGRSVASQSCSATRGMSVLRQSRRRS